MEVVPALSDSSPFQRRDVAEWSHMDRLTGMMETARVETDRWAASNATSAHSYGKVVDSRNRSLPDGSAQQRQRQQLEVYQTKGPGGSLQVIRTQSVTSTNSSWRGTTSSLGSRAPLPSITQNFGNLQLTLNPLDISSEKSKGSVGRSGSIGGRRPPSRPRSIATTPLAIEEGGVNSRVAQVARICQNVHEEKKKTAFTANERALKNISSLRELSSSISSKSSSEITNGHSSISRKKSSSIEDLHNGVSEELDEEEEGLKRTARARRSLQFPLKKFEARGGVSKLLQELEESNNQRNASEGRIARKSFEALENVLKRGNTAIDSNIKSEADDSESILTGSETSGEYNSSHTVNNINLDSFSRRFSDAHKISIEKRHSFADTLDSREERNSSNDEGKDKSPSTKRHSFITVESLNEVRGRLKRLNSPLDGIDTESGMEEVDDGIEAEVLAKASTETVVTVPQSRVKSYVYGMEAVPQSNRQPVPGTGSLESRNSKNSSNSSRSDEWYSRRKSYGFEQVTGTQGNDSSSTLSSKGDESKLESTDSGIFRSSEMFTVPSWSRKSHANIWSKSGDSDFLSVDHSIQVRKGIDEEFVVDKEESKGATKRSSTIVNFEGKNDGREKETSSSKLSDIFKRSNGSGKMLSALLVNGVRSDDSDDSVRNQYVTVSIPVVPEDSSPTVGSMRLFYQQLAQSTSLSSEKLSKQVAKTTNDQSPTYTGNRLSGDDWWMKRSQIASNYTSDSKLATEDWRTPSKLSSAMKRHSFAEDKAWNHKNGSENVDDNVELDSVQDNNWRRLSKYSENDVKRHSIAVDELKYVKEVQPVTGFNVTFAQQSREDTENLALKKQKRVEFCKTEVHFAAEPGRINIVETDEKPPSTNMFRRRRRISNPIPDAAKQSNLPEVRFGDSVYEKHLLAGNEDSQETISPQRPTTLRLNLQEDGYQEREDQEYTHANATIREREMEHVEEETEQHNDYDSSQETKPRSILKNYSRPLPYRLGNDETPPSSVEGDQDEKWGVRLRPVAQDRTPVWKSTVTVSSKDAVMPVEYSGQSELQKLLRSLRPANQSKHEMLVATRQTGISKTSDKVSDWSVADRVRHVEQVASETKGFSTRVNFGAGEATVVDEQSSTNGTPSQRLYQNSDRPKPVWQRREEALISSDGSKFMAGKRNDLVTLNGYNSQDINSMQSSKNHPNFETDLRRCTNTTTKISIDLTPSPTYKENNNLSMMVKCNGNVIASDATPNGILHSPSLIMKSLNYPLRGEEDVTTNSHARRSSLRNLQENNRRRSVELHSNSFIKGGIGRLMENGKSSERHMRTNTRRHSMGIGDRGIADGEGSPNNRGYLKDEERFRENIHNLQCWEFSEEKGCDDEDVLVTSSVPVYHMGNNCVNVAIKERWCENAPEANERSCAEEMVIASQLDAWRALYCDIDSDLSDDSEKADEEVRSYMSGDGEGGSSEVSGSWSRATALKHFQNHAPQEYTAGYSVSDPTDDVHEPQQLHSSVSTTMLPSYGDSGRLRAVETLVSTRSGLPKITSISLRYEGEQDDDVKPTPADAFKYTSRTSISPERRHSSYNETESAPYLKQNVSSTFFEPSFKSKTSMFSQNSISNREGSDMSPTNISKTYSIESHVQNTRERRSYSDKSHTEDKSGSFVPERKMHSPAKQTIVSAESPAQHFTSAVSTFDKQHSISRNQTSPLTTTPYASSSFAQNRNTSHSSSRLVSSFERNVSSSPNSRTSQSPLTVESSSQQTPNRSSSSPTNDRPQRMTFSQGETHEDRSRSARRAVSIRKGSLEKTTTGFDSPTVAMELKQISDTSASPYKSRGREMSDCHDVNVVSRLTSSQVECEIGTVTKTMSRSPSPTKKVISPSKKSVKSDFIGRVRPESPVYQNKERSAFSSQAKTFSKSTNLRDITEKSVKTGSESPIYQNREVYKAERITKSSRSNKSEVEPEKELTECGLDAETESMILEELTRAADQILQAVNGYTDEESRRASSDDEHRAKTEGRVLSTIAERPSRKQTDMKAETLKMNGNVKRTQRTVSKTKLGPTSSTSSVESVTRESRRGGLLKTERGSNSTTSRSASSSRTARMVQRASSRELLLQAHASSSEDVASGTDTKKQRAPPPRRSRTSTSTVNKTAQSSTSKSSRDQQKEVTDSSRSNRERVSSSKTKTRDTTISSMGSSKKTPLTKQYPVKEKNIPGVCSSTPGRDRGSVSRTTTTRTKKSTSSHTVGASPTKSTTHVQRT